MTVLFDQASVESAAAAAAWPQCPHDQEETGLMNTAEAIVPLLPVATETVPLDDTLGTCVAFLTVDASRAVVAELPGPGGTPPLVEDGDLASALRYLEAGHRPNLLIVDVGDGSERGTISRLLAACGEHTQVVAVGSVNDVTLYHGLIGLGVADYLVEPLDPHQLGVALTRLSRDVRPAPEAEVQGCRRIVVLGARGGVGTTSTSVNLACALSRRDKRSTTLVDLDFTFGTIALALDVEPSHGFQDAFADESHIDSLFISRAAVRARENLSVMAGEAPFGSAGRCDPAAVVALFEALDRSNDLVVVDLPRHAEFLYEPVMAEAGEVILVSELTLPALRDTIRILERIRRQFPAKRVHVVINRAGLAQGALDRTEFEKVLNRRVDLAIPYEPKLFGEASGNGKPAVELAPRSAVAQAFDELAARVAPAVKAEAGADGGRRWWRKLAGR